MKPKAKQRASGHEVDHMAYRYRLMPTPEQEVFLLRVAGCCRWVYNKALEKHQAIYASTGSAPSQVDMINAIVGWKKEYRFLKEALSQPLQQAVIDLYDGWQRFFEGQNEKPTWSKFADAPSFRLPQPEQWAITNPKGTRKNVRHFSIPKMGKSGSLGPLVFVQHRPIQGKVQHATIRRDGGFWYVSFTVERRVKPDVHGQRARIEALIEVGAFGPERAGTPSAALVPHDVYGPHQPDHAFGPHPLSVIGCDRNTAANGACVTHRGEVYGAVVDTPARRKQQTRLQRAVARKEEALRKVHGIAPGGSLRPLREKGIALPKRLVEAKTRLAVFQGHLARVREDICHKTSRSIERASDVVVLEDLPAREMTAKAGTVLSGGSAADGTGTAGTVVKVATVSKETRKGILDASWYRTQVFLGYKLKSAGKRLVLVNPAYTSQTCAACKHVDAKNRQGRVFRCVACGHTADADVNAGWNIRSKGIGLLVSEAAAKATARSKALEAARAKGTAQARATSNAKETGTVGRAGVALGGLGCEFDEERKRTVLAITPKRATSG